MRTRQDGQAITLRTAEGEAPNDITHTQTYHYSFGARSIVARQAHRKAGYMPEHSRHILLSPPTNEKLSDITRRHAALTETYAEPDAILARNHVTLIAYLSGYRLPDQDAANSVMRLGAGTAHEYRTTRGHRWWLWWQSQTRQTFGWLV